MKFISNRVIFIKKVSLMKTNPVVCKYPLNLLPITICDILLTQYTNCDLFFFMRHFFRQEVVSYRDIVLEQLFNIDACDCLPPITDDNIIKKITSFYKQYQLIARSNMSEEDAQLFDYIYQNNEPLLQLTRLVMNDYSLNSICAGVDIFIANVLEPIYKHESCDQRRAIVKLFFFQLDSVNDILLDMNGTYDISVNFCLPLKRVILEIKNPLVWLAYKEDITCVNTNSVLKTLYHVTDFWGLRISEKEYSAMYFNLPKWRLLNDMLASETNYGFAVSLDSNSSDDPIKYILAVLLNSVQTYCQQCSQVNKHCECLFIVASIVLTETNFKCIDWFKTHTTHLRNEAINIMPLDSLYNNLKKNNNNLFDLLSRIQ